jgi:hypothetical protein
MYKVITTFRGIEETIYECSDRQEAEHYCIKRFVMSLAEIIDLLKTGSTQVGLIIVSITKE